MSLMLRWGARCALMAVFMAGPIRAGDRLRVESQDDPTSRLVANGRMVQVADEDDSASSPRKVSKKTESGLQTDFPPLDKVEPSCRALPSGRALASRRAEPSCGVEPTCQAEPTSQPEPSCQAEPTCQAEPSCGCHPQGCGCDGCCGRCPGVLEEARYEMTQLMSMGNQFWENGKGTISEVYLNGQCADCCERRWGVVGFAGTDAWKGRVDDDGNNNFGVRGGLNLGVALCEGFSVQLGASYAGYDFHGRANGPESAAIEDQVFITAGVFKRCTCLCRDSWLDRITWGFVYDQMVSDNIGELADSLTIGQARGRVGVVLDFCNEVGVWGAGRVREAKQLGRADLPVNSLDQINAFWHHKWQYGADTTIWAGVAEDPGEVTFGGSGEVPLNDRLALYGNFQYILPSTSANAAQHAFSEEYWNVSVGVTFYLGGCARSNNVLGHRWMPLLPVADNGSFALELPPGAFGP